jgi:O-antigen ligase
MDPRVATLIFAIFILGLFYLDRDPKARTSKALWLPVMWFLIASTRNVGQWLHIGEPPPPGLQYGEQYLEGTPVDRAVLGALLGLGIIVLLTRRRQLGPVLRWNTPVLLYFFYCGLSIMWSDYPFVAFKRWNRALGDLVMVLVILTDPDWLSAIKRVLARVGFLVLPLSPLFIRYYPDWGRSYGISDGAMTWTGVAQGKNGLGIICLVFGLGSLWRILEVCQGREGPRRTRRLSAHGLLLVAALYLLWEAHSMTSTSCFLLASGLMAATSLWASARKLPVLYFLALTTVALCAFVVFSGEAGGILQTMGRNPTLTGRTLLWDVVLRFVANPWFGAGYESFWLGDRLLAIARASGNSLNQSHNGYLEIYVNLGWLGLALLAVVLMAGLRRVVAAVRQNQVLGKLRLAYFLVAVIYNFTEAGFKMMSPVWISLLLSVMPVPKAPVPESQPAPGVDLTDNFGEREPQVGCALGAGFPG